MSLDVTFEADTRDRIIPSDVRSTGSSSGCIIVIDSSGSRMKKAAGAVGSDASVVTGSGGENKGSRLAASASTTDSKHTQHTHV